MGLQHITTYPISHGQLINVVFFRAHYDREGTAFDGPWVCNLRCDFFQAFQDWEPEVRQLLEVRLPSARSFHV